ncbi:MAG: 30S ribosomal protein S4 [Patescibacteria group bacterium]
MKYNGPKNRISRRENTDLGFKTAGSKAQASLLRKLNVKPGQHGTSKRRRKQSEHGKQLREKQKLRYMFGVTDSGLKRYFTKAIRMKGNTGQILGQLLEKRLDNVIYRLGLAPTRASARQLIGHKHVKVNDKLVNIPSFQLKKGDAVKFVSEKSEKIPYVQGMLENTNIIIPEWLERKKLAGTIKVEPSSEDIEKQVNMRSVVEFYSR